MKRENDLCRQLLLDIENQGTDCSLSTLRSGLSHDADERIRYHLRLLIDAGFVKEIDRTSAGVPCVRLTNSGHEFIELVRSKARWREAKWIVQEQTGGQSLTVLRALLTKWAMEGATYGERYRRMRRHYRPLYVRPEPYRYDPRYEPGYRVDTYRFDRQQLLEEEDEPRPPRPRPDYRERLEFLDRFWDRDPDTPYENEGYETPIGITLPVSLI